MIESNKETPPTPSNQRTTAISRERTEQITTFTESWKWLLLLLCGGWQAWKFLDRRVLCCSKTPIDIYFVVLNLRFGRVGWKEMRKRNERLLLRSGVGKQFGLFWVLSSLLASSTWRPIVVVQATNVSCEIDNWQKQQQRQTGRIVDYNSESSLGHS